LNYYDLLTVLIPNCNLRRSSFLKLRDSVHELEETDITTHQNAAQRADSILTENVLRQNIFKVKNDNSLRCLCLSVANYVLDFCRQRRFLDSFPFFCYHAPCCFSGRCTEKRRPHPPPVHILNCWNHDRLKPDSDNSLNPDPIQQMHLCQLQKTMDHGQLTPR